MKKQRKMVVAGVVKNDSVNDSVNHPSHYTFGTYEVIDVIEDWQLGFHLGNAVKYIARAGKKDNLLQDLRKARWYLDRRIAREEDHSIPKEMLDASSNDSRTDPDKRAD